MGIALNEARSRLRGEGALRMESIDDTGEEGSHVSPEILRDWREVPSEALERKEVRQMLQKAITSLPDKYREVFVLRDVEELNNAGTAAALCITVGNVKVRLYRARMMLQKQLTPPAEKYEPKEEMDPVVLDCKHVCDCISGYLDDTLPAEMRDLVQRHLDHCEICSAIVDSTRNILVLTAGDQIFELPIGFSERLHARLDPGNNQLERVVEAKMQGLFHADENESNQRQNQLGEFYSLFVETQRLSAPLGSRAVAKITHMNEDGEVQQRP